MGRGKSANGLLIDVIDAEIFLDSLISTPIDDTGSGSKFDGSRFDCRRLFQTSLQANPYLKALNSTPWPSTSPVKIYAINSKAFQVPFSESILALSQLLSQMSVPHDIVSDINSDADESLYIFLHGTPYSNILHRLPLHYIFWNFEKHPIIIEDDVDGSIAAAGGPYAGFRSHETTGVETVSYPKSFIKVEYWGLKSEVVCNTC